jgi:hypothetical protein
MEQDFIFIISKISDIKGIERIIADFDTNSNMFAIHCYFMNNISIGITKFIDRDVMEADEVCYNIYKKNNDGHTEWVSANNSSIDVLKKRMIELSKIENA